MGYTAVLRNQVGKAMALLGDLRSTVVLTKIAPGNYDPATGLTADVTTVVSFLAPMVRIDEQEQSMFPANKDVRVILAPWTALAGYVVHITDTLTVDGVHLEIHRIRQVPSGAIMKIYVGNP